MKTLSKLYLALFLLLCSSLSAQQYVINGSATKDNCRCYTLTQEKKFETGSVWNAQKISLSNSFDFKFDVYFGCSDDFGADGMTFMLQPLNTNVGTPGEGMGFEGVKPGVAVTMDTWLNSKLSDPTYDHIAIQLNGNVAHDGTELAGPLSISATSNNVEDCKWHTLRILWDAPTKTMTVFFDEVQRLNLIKDFTQDVFGGDPNVFWGFTGATGDNYNLQQFCTRLEPRFKTSSANNTTCVGSPLQFFNQSESFARIASLQWIFGDGDTSYAENPVHTYKSPGLYETKMVITGFDGCTSDTLRRIITVGARPKSDFTANDTCAFLQPRITLGASVPNTRWEWYLNGTLLSSGATPNLRGLPAATYTLQQVSKSAFECPADTLAQSFTLHKNPQISTSVSDACINQQVTFTAKQTDSATTINGWYWTLGDGTSSTVQNPAHTYTQRGRVAVRTWAQSALGCTSDTVVKTVEVIRPFANAGRDTIVYVNEPFRLNGIGQGKFLWMPANNLSANNIPNPVVTLSADQQYVLQVSTNDGCISKDTINIKVTKLLGVFIPNAFTPNGDGLNDYIHPRYYGVKRLIYFTVFNRWGQKVYSTNSMKAIWDGSTNGAKLGTETFVWVIRAEDMTGQIKEEKGTILLIR